MNPLATHLGDRASSLADGELSHSARDRALAHVAVCEHCRADLERERAARAWLRELPDPVLAPSLASRLQAIAEGPPELVAPPALPPMPEATSSLAARAPEVVPILGHRPPVTAGSGRSAPPARSVRPAQSVRSVRPARRRTRVVATGAISLAVMLGSAVMVGGESGPEAPTREGALRPSAAVTSPSPGLSVVTATFVDPASRRFTPAGLGQMVPASALTPVPGVLVPMLAPVGR